MLAPELHAGHSMGAQQFPYHLLGTTAGLRSSLALLVRFWGKHHLTLPALARGSPPSPPLRGRRGPFKKYNVVMLKVVMPVGGKPTRSRA